jgi:hypothetical protein
VRLEPVVPMISHLRYVRITALELDFPSLGASWFRQGSLKVWLRAEVGWPR